MSASPDIFGQTSHHCNQREQYHYAKHNIISPSGDASFLCKNSKSYAKPQKTSFLLYRSEIETTLFVTPGHYYTSKPSAMPMALFLCFVILFRHTKSDITTIFQLLTQFLISRFQPFEKIIKLLITPRRWIGGIFPIQ